jgi:hypothetical protein
VTKWHPATKLLVLAALLVLPYLLWSRAEEPAPAVAAGAAPATPEVAQPATIEAPPPAPFVLPPLERFTAVVERPLFSPTRRMPAPPPRAAPEAPAAPPEAPVAAGLGEPELRFFGTVSQGGVAAALVTFPATAEVARLRPGDPVGDWQVLSVARNRLELGLGDERRSYEIFGAGMRAAPAPAPVEPQPPPPGGEDIPGVDPAGDAFWGDDAPGQE